MSLVPKSVGDAIATATTATHAAGIETPGMHALDVVRVETLQSSSGDIYVIAGLQEAGKPLAYVFVLRFREQAEMNLERFCKSLRGPPEDVLRVLMVVGDALGKTRHGVMRADVNLRTIAEAMEKTTKNGRKFLVVDWRAGVAAADVPGVSLFDKQALDKPSLPAAKLGKALTSGQIQELYREISSLSHPVDVCAAFEEQVLRRTLVASDEES